MTFCITEKEVKDFIKKERNVTFKRVKGNALVLDISDNSNIDKVNNE